MRHRGVPTRWPSYLGRATKPPLGNARRMPWYQNHRRRPILAPTLLKPKIDMKLSSEVFGISNVVLQDSYVDRGYLDNEFDTYLNRAVHIALRGESKCGKSWLRQMNVDNSIIVQCRLGRKAIDIYVDALSQLGIKLDLETNDGHRIKGTIKATGSVGTALLGKLGIETSIGGEGASETKRSPVGKDVNDLKFISDIIQNSGKRLVIEDFHYMSYDERRNFAFDLKALWDYGTFVVIVGVWSRSNLLLHLNPDLTGRVQEISIYWSDADLAKVLDKGARALNIEFTDTFKTHAIERCFGNVGILQSLTLRSLDEAKIKEERRIKTTVGDIDILDSAAMHYAEQINPLYQQFASRISKGIRYRKDSTGIYAHAMAVIMDADDKELIEGLSIDHIYNIANEREPRIQKGNLRVILERFETLQVDEDGRGLVLSYDESNRKVSVVDRQLLLYRKYSTVGWPWEEIINDANSDIDYETEG